MVNRIPVSDQILAGSAASAPAQTDPGAHPASYIMGTGSISQEWYRRSMSYIATPSVCMCKLTFTFTSLKWKAEIQTSNFYPHSSVLCHPSSRGHRYCRQSKSDIAEPLRRPPVTPVVGLTSWCRKSTAVVTSCPVCRFRSETVDWRIQAVDKILFFIHLVLKLPIGQEATLMWEGKKGK
jgi:hypothetical protein